MKNTKRIRIAFDASPLLVNKTGVAYYTEQVVINMARMHPDDVELVGFYYNFLGRRNADHLPKLPNVRYHEVKYLPSKLLYQLRRWRIEVPIEVLTHTKADFVLYPNYLSYPTLTKTPSAPVIHDLAYLDLPQYVSAKNRRDLERFVPLALKRSSFAITISEFTRQGMHKVYGTPLEDIIVTPIPPFKSHDYSDQKRKKVLRELGIQKPYIVFVGTIEPRKNIIQLIEGYKQLSPELRDKYSLVIVGRMGWYCDKEEAALKAAHDEGYDVIYPGYVTEEQREILFSSAVVFSSASHYEGFGMPVLEAMNFGVPCVVSDIAVFREIAGNAASYFDQNDPSSIAKELTNLLNNPKLLAERGKASKQYAHSSVFDSKTIAARIYERIKRTLSEQKP